MFDTPNFCGKCHIYMWKMAQKFETCSLLDFFRFISILEYSNLMIQSDLGSIRRRTWHTAVKIVVRWPLNPVICAIPAAMLLNAAFAVQRKSTVSIFAKTNWQP
jgi:hypothetical protein